MPPPSWIPWFCFFIHLFLNGFQFQLNVLKGEMVYIACSWASSCCFIPLTTNKSFGEAHAIGLSDVKTRSWNFALDFCTKTRHLHFYVSDSLAFQLGYAVCILWFRLQVEKLKNAGSPTGFSLCCCGSYWNEDMNRCPRRTFSLFLFYLLKQIAQEAKCVLASFESL